MYKKKYLLSIIALCAFGHPEGHYNTKGLEQVKARIVNSVAGDGTTTAMMPNGFFTDREQIEKWMHLERSPQNRPHYLYDYLAITYLSVPVAYIDLLRANQELPGNYVIDKGTFLSTWHALSSLIKKELAQDSLYSALQGTKNGNIFMSLETDNEKLVVELFNKMNGKGENGLREVFLESIYMALSQTEDNLSEFDNSGKGTPKKGFEDLIEKIKCSKDYIQSAYRNANVRAGSHHVQVTEKVDGCCGSSSAPVHTHTHAIVPAASAAAAASSSEPVKESSNASAAAASANNDTTQAAVSSPSKMEQELAQLPAPTEKVTGGCCGGMPKPKRSVSHLTHQLQPANDNSTSEAKNLDSAAATAATSQVS